MNQGSQEEMGHRSPSPGEWPLSIPGRVLSGTPLKHPQSWIMYWEHSLLVPNLTLSEFVINKLVPMLLWDTRFQGERAPRVV